ncbi:leukocyte surface antigen CD53 [Rhinophrynus dorsalis]
MDHKCLRLLKYMMFGFNLLFWVTGCSIISIGVYFVINNTYGVLFPDSPSLTVGNAFIVIGIIIMVFGFLGCMGAIKENKCLLLTFFILLLLILLAEVIMAIILFVYEKQLDTYINEKLKNSFEQHQKENNQKSTSKIWVEIQRNGCAEAFRQWFENNFLYVGIVTICISIIEVLGMAFALTLYCHISRNSVSLNA